MTKRQRLSSHVDVIFDGEDIEFDPTLIANVIGPEVVGVIVERTAGGYGLDGKPFAQYTPEYAEDRIAMGRSAKVDMTITGGLLSSVKLLSRKITGGVLEMVFGPGTATSAQVEPPSNGKPRAQRTGKRSPPHNVLGAYLSRKRPWLGLSPKQEEMIRKRIERLLPFRGGSGKR